MNVESVTINNLKALPDIDRFMRLSKSIAMLDAIIMPEWEYRYYSFDEKWGYKEMMASMRNGSGDSYFCLFNDNGVIIKGYERYSPLANYYSDTGESHPDIYKNVPVNFSSFLDEPAFLIGEVTFCIWCLYGEEVWKASEIDINAEYLSFPLRLLDVYLGGAEGYKCWAEAYYEIKLDLIAVMHFFDFKPISETQLKAINPQISMEDLQIDIEKIGYPVARP